MDNRCAFYCLDGACGWAKLSQSIDEAKMCRPGDKFPLAACVKEQEARRQGGVATPEGMLKDRTQDGEKYVRPWTIELIVGRQDEEKEKVRLADLTEMRHPETWVRIIKTAHGPLERTVENERLNLPRDRRVNEQPQMSKVIFQGHWTTQKVQVYLEGDRRSLRGRRHED